MRHIIGILPAGGTGSRLQPFRYCKELLPIRYRWNADAREVAPSLLIEHSLAAMSLAGIAHCVVVISPSKSEIARILGAGPAGGPRLAYVVQEQAGGLADAIRHAGAFVASLRCGTCLSLPDTVFHPLDALRQVTARLREAEADLVLGVFPTDVPEQLGPVALRSDGTVEYVLDKPAVTALRNTWGVAAWGPRFFDLLDEAAAEAEGELILGKVFHDACIRGLSVHGVEFPGGEYHDLGTRRGLTQFVLQTPNSYWASDPLRCEEVPEGCTHAS